MISTIRHIFTNELEMLVSREAVTVSAHGKAFTLRPVVYASTDSSGQRFISISDLLKCVQPSQAVPVFGPLPDGVAAETWVECLHFFMRYVIAKAHFGLVAVRPVVKLRGVRVLGALPAGEAAEVLTTALLRAGVFTCKVDD